MFEVTLLGSFFAGLLSFASPCVLPIVPFYLSYLAGMALADIKSDETIARGVKYRTFLCSLLFSAGMIIVFVGMGASASVFGNLLRDWFGILRWVAALLIFLMGLHFLGFLQLGFLNRQFKLDLGDTKNVNYAMAFLLGFAFAFGWTPCVGPILAAILFTAAGSETIYEGTLLLLAYGIGMTSPFIAASIFVGPFLKSAKAFKAHLEKVEKLTGFVLVIFSVLIATNNVNAIAGWMLQMAPGLWNFG